MHLIAKTHKSCLISVEVVIQGFQTQEPCMTRRRYELTDFDMVHYRTFVAEQISGVLSMFMIAVC